MTCNCLRSSLAYNKLVAVVIFDNVSICTILLKRSGLIFCVFYSYKEIQFEKFFVRRIKVTMKLAIDHESHLHKNLPIILSSLANTYFKVKKDLITSKVKLFLFFILFLHSFQKTFVELSILLIVNNPFDFINFSASNILLIGFDIHYPSFISFFCNQNLFIR